MSDDPTLDLELPEDAADDLPAGGAEDPAALRRLADGYLEADQPAEAAAVLSRLVELTPTDPDPLEERAWTNLASGAIDATRADMALLLERFPESATVAAIVGELHAALGAPEEARFAFDRAVALAGDDPEVLYRAAQGFESVEAPEPALAVYERIMDWRPRGVLLARARLRDRTGDSAGALADLDAALAAPPGGSDPAWDNASTARVLLVRGHIRASAGDATGATADARAALDLVPDEPLAAEGWSLLAELARAAGDQAGAREAGERAVEADPESIAAWTALISIYTGAEDWAGALAVVRRAQALNPDDLSLALSAALIRAEQNDLEGALEDWDRLLTISPENATAYAMRGALNLRLERPRAAEADVNRALSLHADNLVALQTRVSLRLRANNLRGALADLNHALAVEPHDTDLLLLRAGIQMEIGDHLAAAASAGWSASR